MKVIVKKKTISFDPSFTTFVETLTSLLHAIYEAVTVYPRIEDEKSSENSKNMLKVR